MNNDWMSAHEEAEIKRRAYNNLMHGIKNLSPAEEKWIKIATNSVAACAVILICAIFIRITVEVLRGIM